MSTKLEISHLAYNLKLIRKKWKLDQEGFAQLTGVTRGKLSQYELSNTEPRIPFLIKLEDLCGIHIYDLYSRYIGKEEIPESPKEYGQKAVSVKGDGRDDGISLDDFENLVVSQNEIIELLRENRELRKIVEGIKNSD